MKLKAKASFVFFLVFYKQKNKAKRKMLVFALEAPERVMERAMETKSLGGTLWLGADRSDLWG